jgi:hypothetical protein
MSFEVPEPVDVPTHGQSTSSLPTLARLVSFAWVPITASLVSLALSVTNLVAATREPEILVVPPQQIRVAQGEDFGFAYVYAQPAFVHTGQNDRIEVIRDMALRVTPFGGGAPIEFKWDEQAELVYDNVSKSLNYRYVADAVPLLVSPRNAQVPFAVFNGPQGSYFKAGTHRVTIVAHRVVHAAPLESTFVFTMTDKDVEVLSSSRGHKFLAFPTRKP